MFSGFSVFVKLFKDGSCVNSWIRNGVDNKFNKYNQ